MDFQILLFMVLFLYLYSISGFFISNSFIYVFICSYPIFNSSFSDSSIYITFFIFFLRDSGYFLARHPFFRWVTMFSLPVFLEDLVLLDGINRVFGLGVSC
jgi:hypothetical protein